jgi:hypothetical protein
MLVIVTGGVLVSLMLNLLMGIVKELAGYHIVTGRYGTNVRLDGLRTLS